MDQVLEVGLGRMLDQSIEKICFMSQFDWVGERKHLISNQIILIHLSKYRKTCCLSKFRKFGFSRS